MKLRLRQVPIEELKEGVNYLNLLIVDKIYKETKMVDIVQGPCILEYHNSDELWCPVEVIK
jgi:hypothetical protein